MTLYAELSSNSQTVGLPEVNDDELEMISFGFNPKDVVGPTTIITEKDTKNAERRSNRKVAKKSSI